MKTTNWQTKALILFIAAIALCLATACGETDTEYTGPYRITPSAPCGDDVPIEPSKEFRQFVGPEYLYELHGPERKNQAARERAKRLKPEKERIEAILGKYSELMSRQNNGEVSNHVIVWRVTDTQTEEWWPTDKLIIEITVREYVDQRSFPPEDRIPECMDGIEVHFDAAPYLRSIGPSVSNIRIRS